MSSLKTLKRFISLLIILLLGLVAFSLFYPRIYSSFSFNRNWPLKRAEMIREKIESLNKKQEINLILGSCGGEASIRADLLSKITGKPWLNFTLRGAQPSFHQTLLNKIKIEAIKLDQVLFVVEPTDLTKEQFSVSKRFVTKDFEKRLLSLADILNSNQHWTDKLDELFVRLVYSDILPWVFTESLMLELDRSRIEEFRQYRAFTLEKSFEDFEPWSEQTAGTVQFNWPHAAGIIEQQSQFLLSEKFEVYLSYSEKLEGRLSLQPSKELIEEMLSVMNDYKKVAKNIVVIFPPEPDILYFRDPARREKIKNLANAFISKGFRVIVSSDQKLNLNHPYLDFDHLSLEAASVYSQELAKALEGQ